MRALSFIRPNLLVRITLCTQPNRPIWDTPCGCDKFVYISRLLFFSWREEEEVWPRSKRENEVENKRKLGNSFVNHLISILCLTGWLFISSRWRHLLSFKLVFDARHTEASLLRPHYPLSNHKNNNSWLMTMVPSLFRHARLRIKRMETSQDSNIWSVSIQGRHPILVHFGPTFSFSHQKNKSKSTKNIKRKKSPSTKKLQKANKRKTCCCPLSFNHFFLLFWSTIPAGGVVCFYIYIFSFSRPA